jgi:hypothetical protein
METAALVVDTFLFSLAWVVQLVVYPGFRWVDTTTHPHWHRVYANRIVVLTLPSMLLQIGLHGYLVFVLSSPIAWATFILVAGTWIATFGRAIQLHQKIQELGPQASVLRSLLSVHAIRTTLWTVVFLLQLTEVFLG